MAATISTRRILMLAALIGLFATLAGTGRAEAASPQWKLLAVTGPTHIAPYAFERQTVIFKGGSATFTLTFAGDTTSPLTVVQGDGDVESSTPPAAEVEAALNALPSVNAGGGSVSVAQVPHGPDDRARYVVAFDGGPLAGADVPSLTGAATNGATVSASPTPSGWVAADLANVGGAPTDGSAVTIEFDLPSGFTPLGTSQCAVAGQHVTCSRAVTVPSREAISSLVDIGFVAGPGAPASSLVEVTASGGGTLTPAAYSMPIVVSATPASPGIQAMWAAAFDENGNPYTQAGGHPANAGAAFRLNTLMTRENGLVPAGALRDVKVDLPAGLVGNPLVTARCPQPILGAPSCGSSAIVGNADPILQTLVSPSNNDSVTIDVRSGFPARGYAAEFTFKLGDAKASVLGGVRPDDFGVGVIAPNITSSQHVFGSVTMLDGTPAAAAGKAFWTNPTECTGLVLPTLMSMSTWQAGGVFSTPVADNAPAVTNCAAVPFEPVSSIATSSQTADSASGLTFDLEVPQDGLLDPEEIATSHLDDVTVDLPEGLAVNPSGATGLKGCSDVQMAPGTKTAPSCPDGSKLGSVEVTSPLVDHAIGGTLYLGTPKSTDPMSGEMLRLWVVARDDETGTLIKLPGSSTADPSTGKLTATFENNPRLPFDHLEVKLRGGSKGLLAMPQDCGEREIATTLVPWSGNAAVEQSSPVDVTGCSLGFAPSLAAGMSSQQARGSGTFAFRFSRNDGEQWVDGLTAKLPEGLLATVKGVPLCSNGQAAAGACPEGSRIGTVDATAGSGDPFVLEQKGSAYLTEGYKGCPYGLAIKVPVIAGPFDKSSPQTDLGDIVVRQAVCVDRSTAEVSAISDPIPTIWHGIPLRVRSVTVSVDRSEFMLNPSDCGQKQVGATFDSERGAIASQASPFSASGCSNLPFKPKLVLSLTGKKQTTTGKHPGIKAQVTQAGVGEAGISQAVVRLPKSLALDPDNAQALCEFEDGTKPDLENHCPKGSIVGRARAITPLLNQPLAGNVYFVKNVRRDPNTGNLIRTLPMLIVALRGEIAINLRGESSTTKGGKLVNTFAAVPDGPITQFNLNIRGGRSGIIAVTRTRRARINLCAGRHIAEVDNDGQNGRRHDFDVQMKTPCTKKQTKNAKRAAKKAARKARR